MVLFSLTKKNDTNPECAEQDQTAGMYSLILHHTFYK